jgi:hypothetical protein
MPEGPVQSYENHVRREPMITVSSLLTVIALIVAVVGVALDNTRVVGAAVILAALGSVLVGVIARSYSVKVQDRIIRLEMRLRLARVLPDDLKGRVMEFTLGQLIALRFASDEELPDLARKVLNEKIAAKDTIKKLIKNWQPDFHRV